MHCSFCGVVNLLDDAWYLGNVQFVGYPLMVNATDILKDIAAEDVAVYTGNVH